MRTRRVLLILGLLNPLKRNAEPMHRVNICTVGSEVNGLIILKTKTRSNVTQPEKTRVDGFPELF